MYENVVIVTFYGSLAGVATLLGIWLMLTKEEWSKTNAHFINSSAAGLILGLAFFHLIPEAIALTDNLIYYSIFIGFFAFYVVENVLVIHSGPEMHFAAQNRPLKEDDDECHCEKHTHVGEMSFLGLAFHSLLDGVIIGIGYEIDPLIGFLTAVAVIAHELPEGITSFALMIGNGLEKGKAIRMSVIVALATPIGAIFALVGLQGLQANIVGLLLGFAAGTFIYIAASDMIPETHEAKGGLRTLLAFLVGALFIFLLTIFFGE